MCFSAETSFIVGGGLIPLGAVCVRVAVRTTPQLQILAITPCVFAVQQFCEGIVWLTLDWEDPGPKRTAACGYLFFALAFWPLWCSLSLALLEPSRWRKQVLMGWAILSSAWFWFFYLPLLAEPSRVNVGVVEHSLRYEYADGTWLDPTVRWSLRALYVLTVAGPLLMSSSRRSLFLPVVLGLVSAGISLYLFEYAFTSVWCLFAAVVSVSLLYSISASNDQGNEMLSNLEHQQPSSKLV